MMIQMHNERGNAISLDWDLEVVEVESKWRNERNCKKKLKNHVFQFHINTRKIRTVMQIEIEWTLVAAHKGKSENWFRMTMRNAPRRRKWCWWIFHFAQSCEIVGAHAKLLELVRNCIFSKFLDEEASRRPFRWCQVSTWPWPINRHLIYSFMDFWYIF